MIEQMDRINPKLALGPKAAITDNTAAVTGIIDMVGYESCTFVILTGVESDADATFAVTMEHGNDSALGDSAVPASTDLVGTGTTGASFTFAGDNICTKLGYIGSKRYTRMTITPTNNTGNFFVAVTAILGNPHVAPTANPPN